jgi:hypothetical protein
MFYNFLAFTSIKILTVEYMIYWLNILWTNFNIFIKVILIFFRSLQHLVWNLSMTSSIPPLFIIGLPLTETSESFIVIFNIELLTSLYTNLYRILNSETNNECSLQV